MFTWAALFLVLAIVAGIFGMSGVAGMSMHIAWILFIVGLVLAIAFFVMGRRPRI